MNVGLLHESWRHVAKVGDEATQFFYSHLFLSHPETRSMFPVSMAAQRDRFFLALGHIVSHVEELSSDKSYVEQLGRDHRRFDVESDHYPLAGASLLATLEHFLGELWTEETAATWEAAYQAVAQIMIDAAAESAKTTPAWWDAEVVGTERKSLDVTTVQLRPTAPYEWEPGQSFALEVPQRPREWRYYTPAHAPRENGTIELHVQIVPGGQVSAVLARSLEPGQRVRMGAPLGQAFTLPEAHDAPLLMVAGGTGLAPLRAVLDSVPGRADAGERAREVHLFHGVRHASALYDHALLSALDAQAEWFHYTPVVSEDPLFDGAHGLVGSVAAQARDWTGFTPMVCGGPEMVEHTVAELVGVGLPAEIIRTENYAGTTVTKDAADAAPAYEVAP